MDQSIFVHWYFESWIISKGGLVFATTYPRIRVSTSIYTWIISRGGVLFPTTYPRIRVSTSIYTWIISRGGVVFATTYTRIRVSTSISTWIIFRRGVVFATTYPRIRSLQGSSFEMAGYSAVTPAHLSSPTDWCPQRFPAERNQGTNN